MEQFLPENEYKEVEGRVYLNPQLSVDEGNAFIDNLRAAQAQQNQQIATDTRMLGTDIQSDLGGLVGANSYFTSRYQTPQTNSAVANLRAVAQANALNQALANEQEMWKKRYNDAYRNYQRRANSGGGGGGGTPGNVEGGIEYEPNDSPEREVGNVEPSYSPMGSGDFSYTPGGLNVNSGSKLPVNTGALQLPSNNLLPTSVNIQRDKFGKITSLTYNGKTFTGDAAQKRYNFLQSSGTIGGRQ